MLIHGNSGLTALFGGQNADARAAFSQQLVLCRGSGHVPIAHEGLLGLAAVNAVEGDPRRAARLAGAAEARQSDRLHDPVVARLHTTYLDTARARCGSATWTTNSTKEWH
jgi:hypothetical protein